MSERNYSNRRVVINLLMIIAGMLMLVAASPSLYEAFCKFTGIDGTPRIASEYSKQTVNRKLIVRFDSNTDDRLNWEFEPEQQQVKVKVGENGLAFYYAKNNSDKPVIGRSTYNVVPEKAAKYFNKVECFCFINQEIKPGQKITFPVSFFIDPEFVNDKFMDDVETITLSYTFYLVEDE